MKIKQLFGKLKQINHNHILAVIFLALIFMIGAATLPSTIVNAGNYLKNEKTEKNNILKLRDKVDEEYRNMLAFEGNYVINKGSYINLNGLMARVMGQRCVNERVKLDNGHLTSTIGKKNITLPATQLTKLCNAQKEKGKHFLFVLAPFQIPKYEDIMPIGYTDYSNQNADDLLDALRNNGVPVLDLREEMYKDGINHTDAFFKTDHHWKPETGFWAYTKIVDYLTKEKILEPVDSKYTNINEYNVEVYKDWFLGSAGKRTGSYYAGVDDLSIITPKFKTDIFLEIPSLNVSAKGVFQDVAFNYARNVKDYFNAIPYGAYGYGDRDFKYYRNSLAPTNLKILTIGDSFRNASFTFLPLIVDEYNELDMRHYKGNFQEHYSEFEPDILIVLINPGSINTKNTTYDFFDDLKK